MWKFCGLKVASERLERIASGMVKRIGVEIMKEMGLVIRCAKIGSKSLSQLWGLRKGRELSNFFINY